MSVREEDHADGPRRRPRWLAWLPEALVLLVVIAAFANAQYDLGHRWLGLEKSDPTAAPADVRPPTGLDLVAGAPASPVAVAETGGKLDAGAVRAALAEFLDAADLGKHVAIRVSELGSGKVVFERGADAVTPASTLKLLTTTAALEVLGPMTRFETTVVGSGDEIVLVGGGDPFLSSGPVSGRVYPDRADLTTLARRTADALKASGTRKVSLSYDASLFTGPALNPRWPDTYFPENVVPPISALWVDEAKDPSGRYVENPAAAAAKAFATALRREGIRTRGSIDERESGIDDAQLAVVRSAPVGEIVQQTLAVSDNNAAEVLARHVGAASGDASFRGGTAAVLKTLRGLGVDTAGSQVYDGSGLSRENLLTPAVLAGVLSVASSAEHPELREVITGLPVAGFTGSLQRRFAGAPAEARGRVLAKTGTLRGVNGLAGIASDLDGNLMSFVLIADRVQVSGTLAQHDLDLMAGALGACRCGKRP